MTVKELFNEAIENEERFLILFLDFLVNEKKVISYNDDISVLDRYYLDKNKQRMNELLMEYAETDRGKQLLGGKA